MKPTFPAQIRFLREKLLLFDPDSLSHKLACLKTLSSLTLPIQLQLVSYYEMLLFLQGYPGSPEELSLVKKEIKRITALLKNRAGKPSSLFENTGLPFSDTVGQFSHDGVRWLIRHPHLEVTLDSFEEPPLSLNDVLRLTLPTAERSETTKGFTNNELLNALRVPGKQRLSFILNELSRFDPLPFVKDHFFDRLSLFVRLRPKHAEFSKAYNRLADVPVFYHHELVRKLDPMMILDQPLPSAIRLNAAQQESAIRVVKNAMAITARETDPTTFMMERSFRLFHLDRGISVAIYDMIPARQLPLESYVGFTAFKNGYPAAYGGAWIFGAMASFGLNIFETFRSGESAYVMAQLLRTYRQVFGLTYLEIEPYQFGLDNPEGIASGAFWFYYRFGFRPADPELRKKAEAEALKIRTRNGYRSSPKVLTDFTGSHLILNFSKKTPHRVLSIIPQITSMIQRKFKGDRSLAEAVCVEKFKTKTRWTSAGTKDESVVMREVALWAEAWKIEDPLRLSAMVDMIHTKPLNVYSYQAALKRFLSKEK